MANRYMKIPNIINQQKNVNQNHGEITPYYLLEWLLSKKEEITSVAKDIEKREH